MVLAELQSAQHAISRPQRAAVMILSIFDEAIDR
jgi:hypothetical protein